MSSAVGFASLDVRADELKRAFERGVYPPVPERSRKIVEAGLKLNPFNQELFKPLCVKGGTLDSMVAPLALDVRGSWLTPGVPEVSAG